MASSPNSFHNLLILALLSAAILVSAFQFQVGDTMGWKKPTGNELKTYNEWAAQNRFRIGDSLQFKYEKDSVLVVSSAEYLSCNASNPMWKFDDGSTVFRFDRSGFFYFISGEPGHCSSAQRLIVRVMHPSNVSAPEIAPSPAPTTGGGGDSGEWNPPPEASSATKLVSYWMSGILVLVTVGEVVNYCF